MLKMRSMKETLGKENALIFTRSLATSVHLILEKFHTRKKVKLFDNKSGLEKITQKLASYYISFSIFYSVHDPLEDDDISRYHNV